MKHLTKAMLSVLLVVCLALGMTVPAFAAVSEETKTIKYVSLGDSMTNGYGLTNYDNNGFNTYGEEAYPNQFADWLVENGYADSVEHTQLAMSAMRAEDLHFVLEYPVDNADAFAAATSKTWDEEAWNAIFPVGDFYTWDEFTTARFRQNCVNVNEAAKVYQAAVADADIISIGTGNANFGVFLMGRLTNAIGFNGDASEDAWIDLDRAIAECDETTREYIYLVKAELDKILAEKLAEIDNPQLNELSAPLYNAVSYTAVSYVLNYAGALERVLKLNPDAQIMLVGIMNTMAGMNVAVEKDGVVEEVPMSDLLAMIVEPVNTFIAALPTVMQAVGNETYANAEFFYAEAPEVECMVSTYETAIRNPQSVVRARFVEEIVGSKGDGMVWSMVAPMFEQTGLKLSTITVRDITAYEANPYVFLTDINKMISCAVYLGFENAVVKASALSTVPASSFEVFAGGDLSGVFAGVGEKLMANPSALANPVVLTETLTDALTSDETLMGLLHFFGRMLIGNGLGAHPSVSGHNELAETVIASYANGYTAKDETMKNLVIAGEYGKELLKEAYDYAEANGYIDQAEAALAALEKELITLNAELMALKAEVEAQVEAQAKEQINKVIAEAEAKIAEVKAMIAEVKAQIAALKAKIVETVNAVNDCVESTIATAKAQIAALVAEVNALVDEVKADVAELENCVNTTIDAVKAAVDNAVNEVKNAIVEKAEEIKAEINATVDGIKNAVVAKNEQIKASIADMKNNTVAGIENAIDKLDADLKAMVIGQVNTVKGALIQMYLDATTADYELSNLSYYVSFGDDAASAEALVNRWEAKYNTTLKSKNLASVGQTVADTLDVIAQNAADVKKADLITLDYSNNTFMYEASIQVLSRVVGAPTKEYDWAALVGEDATFVVYEALDRVYDEMVAAGLDAVTVGEDTAATLATLAVESLAYNTLSYAKTLPVAVGMIREINPDAVVAIVGMHNALDGTVFELDNISFELGEYVDAVVDVVDTYGIGLCLLNGDAIYVQAQDVETAVSNKTVNVVKFITQYIADPGFLAPTAEGHAYIAEQLDIAINETFLLNGDVDNDGDLDMKDAMLLYSVVGGVKEFAEGEGALADFDMNGVINMRDVMALYAVVSGE